MRNYRKIIEQKFHIQRKTRDSFDTIMTWISVGIFLFAILAFFIIDSAAAIVIFILYVIIKIFTYIRKRI